MEIKLVVDLKNGNPPRTMFTNMLAITEWERTEHRNVKNLLDTPLFSDFACWAHTLCKLAGDKVPDTWREWVQQYPNMTILQGEDLENPNPTVAAPTAAN